MVTRQSSDGTVPEWPAPIQDRHFLIHPLAELNAVLSRTPVDLSSLGRQLALYPGLAKEVLRRCQSSFPDGSVSTIDEAVLHLGIEKVRILLITTVLVDFCRSRLIPSVWLRFWQQAQFTARSSESLARMTGYGWPERAYLAGLLHDVGKLLLFPACTEEEGMVLLDCQESGGVNMERARFGTDHVVLGKWMGLQWRLSDSVIEVIAHHHHPQNGRKDPQLVNIVALADWIAREEIRRGNDAQASIPGGLLPDEDRSGELELE